jgi:hypothetical protein
MTRHPGALTAIELRDQVLALLAANLRGHVGDSRRRHER